MTMPKLATRMTGGAVTALAVAAALMLVSVLPAEAGTTWRSTTSAAVDCRTGDATPQICDPAHIHRVKVRSGVTVHVRRLRFVASSEHCSSARLIVYLNGKRLGRTGWVGPGEATVMPLAVVLRHRRGGRAHRFTYRAEGRVEGCNTGFVGSWAGTIRLSGNRTG